MSEWRLENILRKFIKGGIFLIPFLVLIVSRSLPFPYITGKGFLFLIVVEALFAAYLVLLILGGRQYAPRKNILLLASAFFIFVIFLADVFGVNSYRSFWSTFERMEGFMLYLHLFIFFVISSAVLNRRDWFLFFHISILVSLFVSGYALLEKNGILKASNSGRVFSTMGNPIYLAIYLYIHLFLAVFYFFKNHDHGIRFMYAAIFIFELFIFSITGVRSVFLGIIGAFIVALVIKMFLSAGRKEKFFWGASAVFIVLIPFFLIIGRDNDFVKNNSSLNRFSLIDFSENTARSRVILWKIGIKSFIERPILGWGQENFMIPYAINYDSKLYGNESWFDRVHSTLLQWLVDAGIFGLVGYLSVIAAGFSALNKIWKKRVWNEGQFIVFLAFAAGYFIQSFFVFDALVSYFLLAAILGFLVCESDTDAGENGKRCWVGGKLFLRLLSEKWKFILRFALIIFVFASMIVLVVAVNGKAIRQGKLLIKALSAIESKTGDDLSRIKMAATGFENVFSVDSFGLEEARTQLFGFILEAFGRMDKSFLEDENFISLLDTAINEMEKETKRDALNLRSFISLIRLYEIRLILYQNEKDFILTESAFRDAFYFKNFAQLYFYFAEYYLNLGNNKAAASVATRILENFGDSPKILSDAEIIFVISGYHDDAWKVIYKNTVFGQWPSAVDFLQFGKIAIKQGNAVEASRYGINALKLTEDKQFKKEIFLFLYEAEKMSGNLDKAEVYMTEAKNTGL